MQREKFSDITVNIDKEKIIKSASFGYPLLVFPGSVGSSSTNVYLECDGYDDAISKYISAAESSTKTVPLTKPNEKTTWTQEKGGITTFKGTGSIYTNGVGSISSDSGGLVRYKGIDYNYLDCYVHATIKFNSQGFNRATLKFGVAMVNTSGAESSNSADYAIITILKNNEVIATYNVTKDEPLMISKKLDKPSSGTTDEYTIKWSKGVYIFNLAVYDLSVRVMDALETFYSQTNATQKIGMFLYYFSDDVSSSDMTALFEQDWRSMVYVGNPGAFIEEASRYAEIKKDKLIYILDDGNWSDTHLEFSNRNRTVLFYNNNDATGKGSKTITALIAETASKPVGSFTYKNISLVDVPSANVTASELKALHQENINSYVTKCGVGVTSEGKTMSGEYIDVIDAEDWLVLQIEYQLQQCLINNDKIPYDNKGIAMLENIVVNILQEAYNNGMIAEDDDGQPSYSVSFAKRSETKASDRADRQYLEGKFSFDLAGAIHSVTINGTINI